MTKPTKWVCAQRRLRSAWASAQSDQSSLCAQWVALRTQSFFMRTAKTLIRLGGCPGWSESSLGAHAILLVLSCRGSCFCVLLRFSLKSTYMTTNVWALYKQAINLNESCVWEIYENKSGLGNSTQVLTDWYFTNSYKVFHWLPKLKTWYEWNC